MSNENMIIHPLRPIINEDSEILILGSFPSVKSRELNFFYKHPQNRFWKILSHLYNEDFYNCDNENKRLLCLKHHIAIYDVIYSCSIKGSSDYSIENVIANDIKSLIQNTNIKHIFCNGNKSYSLFIKYNPSLTNIVTLLPSSSPANAKMSLDNLIDKWQIIKNSK